MKSIVILGAGTGGSIVANILSKKLPKTEFKITVIDRSDTHFYQPGLLFIPFKLYGYEGESDIRRQVSDVLSDRVEFVRADISRIDHENNTVETSAGKFQYDWLVSSLGCHVDADEVGGCSEAMGQSVHTFYTVPGALQLRDAFENFHEGHLVVDIAESPIKCPVAPIEFVFLADYFFQLRGERDKVKITLVTPMAGAFSKPNANQVLTRIAAEKNINIVPNFEIESIDAASRTMHAFNGDSMSYDLLTIVPPTRGPAVLGEAGLANDMNYGLTNPRTLKSKVANNIYFIGDNADLPTSKAGSVAHFEAETVVNNLLREIQGKTEMPTFDGHANCFIESGFHKALLIDFNYDVEPLPGSFPMPYVGPFSLLENTYANHLGKIAFDGIYWNLIVSGSMPDMPFVPAHMSMVGKDLDSAKETKKAHTVTVRQLMTTNVITVKRGSPVQTAAKILQDNGISGVPVLDQDDRLAGILTASDLVGALDVNAETVVDKLVATLLKKGRNKKLGTVVEDLMTPNPVTIDPEVGADEAIARMAKHDVNRLIVSSDGRAVEGILSRQDLLKIYN